MAAMRSLRWLLGRRQWGTLPASAEDAPPRLPRLLAGRRPLRLSALVANGIAQAGLAIGIALLVEATFNRVVAGGAEGSVGALAPLLAALTGAALAFGVLRARERVDAERLGQSYVHALRTRMYEHLSDLSPRALQRRSHGSLLMRFVGDLKAIARWVSLGLSRAVVGGTFIGGALGALAFISPGLALAVGAVIMAGALLAVLSAQTLGERAREARRRRSRLAANVTEKVASIGVVQVFGQTERERERLRKQSRRLQRAMVNRAKAVGRMRGLAEVTALLATVAVLLAGAHEVEAGRATPGTIVAGLAIVGLLVNPIRDLGRVSEYWTNARISMEKVRSFLATPNLVRVLDEAPDLAPVAGRLEFDDIHVEGALEGFSATAEPGSLTVLVGPNGAGKSTLLAVAARLIDPDRGSVRLDGQALAEHSLASVRRAVSMVGPDLPLLRGTVDDNLRYRWPEAPDEEFARAADLLSLDQLLSELPDGAETKVTEGGRNLSAGQRQRLALGRALVGSPRVLLLDEADANLDAEARALVDQVIRAQRGRSTLIVVSHREVLEWADAIWRLDNGRLAAADPTWRRAGPRLAPGAGA
jgi:ABC-type multidrug transport system fused ATPase/permease subunit